MPEQRADLLEKRLPRAGQRRCRDPEQDQQQRREGEQRVERERRGLADEAGLVEALHQAGKHAYDRACAQPD